ncbi:MAG: hypothetical protein COV71_05845 [Candidatus Omnitrophica bacterium CG11_big_fil_rev_8_21_14_0_20_41_12]|nr:MAG: hypothetical protein COV71_05845 [Candidatus Omnitrophica bacterium CG11_big_fil_rev_8_21_14_0_20_41_12]
MQSYLVFLHGRQWEYAPAFYWGILIGGNNMRKCSTLFIIILTFTSISCATFDPKMLIQSNDAVSNRLLPLEISNLASTKFEQSDVKDLSTQSYFYTLFERELEKNIILTDPNGTIYGNIEPRVILFSIDRSGQFLSFLSGASLFILNVLGMPIDSYRGNLEIKIFIYNRSQKIIKKYDYISSRTFNAGFYYGTMDERVMGISLMRGILRDFKKDIEKDAAVINEQLRKN